MSPKHPEPDVTAVARDDIHSIRKRARRAGLLYLLLGISAPIGLMYVPGKLIVAGDATATAERIRNSEWLLRLSIGSELFQQITVIFVALALYQLFKAVNQRQAVLMVVLGALVSVPIMFVNVLNEVAALILAKGAPFLAVFDRAQLDALSYLFVRLHSHGFTVASVFWGLWLFPFGILVIQSRFIPRFLGYLLLIAGAAYVVSAFATLVVPAIRPFVNPVALPLEMCEVPIIFWLLIWGAKEQRQRGDAAAPAAA